MQAWGSTPIQTVSGGSIASSLQPVIWLANLLIWQVAVKSSPASRSYIASGLTDSDFTNIAYELEEAIAYRTQEEYEEYVGSINSGKLCKNYVQLIATYRPIPKLNNSVLLQR